MPIFLSVPAHSADMAGFQEQRTPRDVLIARYGLENNLGLKQANEEEFTKSFRGIRGRVSLQHSA